MYPVNNNNNNNNNSLKYIIHFSFQTLFTFFIPTPTRITVAV